MAYFSGPSGAVRANRVFADIDDQLGKWRTKFSSEGQSTQQGHSSMYGVSSRNYDADSDRGQSSAQQKALTAEMNAKFLAQEHRMLRLEEVLKNEIQERSKLKETVLQQSESITKLQTALLERQRENVDLKARTDLLERLYQQQQHPRGWADSGAIARAPHDPYSGSDPTTVRLSGSELVAILEAVAGGKGNNDAQATTAMLQSLLSRVVLMENEKAFFSGSGDGQPSWERQARREATTNQSAIASTVHHMDPVDITSPIARVIADVGDNGLQKRKEAEAAAAKQAALDRQRAEDEQRRRTEDARAMAVAAEKRKLLDEAELKAQQRQKEEEQAIEARRKAIEATREAERAQVSKAKLVSTSAWSGGVSGPQRVAGFDSSSSDEDEGAFKPSRVKPTTRTESALFREKQHEAEESDRQSITQAEIWAREREKEALQRELEQDRIAAAEKRAQEEERLRQAEKAQQAAHEAREAEEKRIALEDARRKEEQRIAEARQEAIRLENEAAAQVQMDLAAHQASQIQQNLDQALKNAAAPTATATGSMVMAFDDTDDESSEGGAQLPPVKIADFDSSVSSGQSGGGRNDLPKTTISGDVLRDDFGSPEHEDGGGDGGMEIDDIDFDAVEAFGTGDTAEEPPTQQEPLRRFSDFALHNLPQESGGMSFNDSRRDSVSQISPPKESHLTAPEVHHTGAPVLPLDDASPIHGVDDDGSPERETVDPLGHDDSSSSSTTDNPFQLQRRGPQATGAMRGRGSGPAGTRGRGRARGSGGLVSALVTAQPSGADDDEDESSSESDDDDGDVDSLLFAGMPSRQQPAPKAGRRAATMAPTSALDDDF